MLRVKRISAELAWICFGQLMVAAGGVFGVRLLTYRIGPSVYGDLAIGMTVAVLAQQIIFSPLGQSFLRYFSSAYKDGRLNVYIKTAGFLLAKAAILIVIIAVILIMGLFFTGHTKWIWLFSLALLYSLFSGCNIVLDYVQNAARHRKIVALHQGAGQWLDFLIPVGLIVLWGPYSFIAMLGYVVASAIILRSELRFFRSKIAVLGAATAEKASIDTVNRYAKTILAFAWPLSAWSLFTWAHFVSGRWALLSFTSIRDVGLYSVLYQFGYYPIIMVSGIASQMITPVLFSRAGSGDDPVRVTDTIKTNSIFIAATVVITIVFVAFSHTFHKELFSLVVAPEYRSVSYLLPLLVLSGGLLAIGQMTNITFFVKANTQVLIYPKIVTAVFGVLLNYLGAYFYGLIGVVVAGVIFSLVYLFWIIIVYRHKRSA